MPKEKQKSKREKREWLDETTGELLQTKEQAQNLIDEINLQNQKNNAIKKALREDFELSDEKVLVYQRGKYYVKLYKISFETLLLLSTNAKALFTTMVCLSDKDDNSVCYENKHITNTELIEISKMSRNVLRLAVEELEYYGIIVVEGGNRNRKIYLNPLLVEDTATDSNIHKKFKEV
jgi:hypothetical protein